MNIPVIEYFLFFSLIIPFFVEQKFNRQFKTGRRVAMGVDQDFSQRNRVILLAMRVVDNGRDGATQVATGQQGLETLAMFVSAVLGFGKEVQLARKNWVQMRDTKRGAEQARNILENAHPALAEIGHYGAFGRAID